jgi:hypothetical protein
MSYNNITRYQYRNLAIQRGKQLTTNSLTPLLYDVIGGCIVALFLVAYILF